VGKKGCEDVKQSALFAHVIIAVLLTRLL